MKCEKCNQQEAVFHYSSSINGRCTERHLCADCARAEGFGEMPLLHPEQMMEELFTDFLAPRVGLLSAFDSFDAPFRRMMAPWVEPEQRQTAAPCRAPLSEAEQKIPSDAGSEVRARREIAALRAQLDEAVRTENYEKAIELRDRLRGIEGG